MSYTIEAVDIQDPETELQLRQLIQQAFKTEQMIPEGHLYENTTSARSSQKTLFLAAKEHGRIIGCNGFMATDFMHQGRLVPCFQSCWTATHPSHQGRGIFGSLINEAKVILKAQGAGFIYGLGNDNSHPILVKKLGFREMPSIMVQIPNLPIVKGSFLNRSASAIVARSRQQAYAPVERQISDIKKHMSGSGIVELSVGGSYVWGRVLQKNLRLGIKLSYFYIGGMELASEADFYEIYREIFNRYKVQYLQVVSCQSNLYNEFFRNWKPTVAMNGFIFFELNTEPLEHVNLFYGAIDVF